MQASFDPTNLMSSIYLAYLPISESLWSNLLGRNVADSCFISLPRLRPTSVPSQFTTSRKKHIPSIDVLAYFPKEFIVANRIKVAAHICAKAHIFFVSAADYFLERAASLIHAASLYAGKCVVYQIWDNTRIKAVLNKRCLRYPVAIRCRCNNPVLRFKYLESYSNACVIFILYQF